MLLGDDKRVDVFEPNLNHGDLLLLAQRYARETIVEEIITPDQTFVTTETPFEQVRVEDITIVSPIESDRLRSGTRQIEKKAIEKNVEMEHKKRPCSLMIQRDDGENKRQDFPGMFVSQKIGKDGGCLTLNHIHLNIPEGAVDSDVDIRLGIIWDTDLFPPLKAGEAILSPVVACQPHGEVFKKPVQLTLPHCAFDILKGWKPTVQQSNTSLHEAVKWEPLGLSDYEERKINSNNVQVSLKHFTLFALTGTSQDKVCAKKWVHLVPFAPQIRKGNFFKVKVFCTDSFTEPEIQVSHKLIYYKEKAKHTQHTHTYTHILLVEVVSYSGALFVI